MTGGILLTSVFLVGVVIIYGSQGRFESYNSRTWLFIFLAAFFDFWGLCMATIAFQRDRSGSVALLGFLNVVWAYLADILIFDELLNTIEFCWAIAILIFSLGTATYKVITQHMQMEDSLHQPLIDKKAEDWDKNSAAAYCDLRSFNF